jgi:DNA-binding transcriptional regulator YiaG
MVRRHPKHRPLRPRRPSVPKFDVPDDIDPRAVRQSLGCTQERFAGLIGVSVRTIQAWERLHWMRLAPGERSENGSMWKCRHRRPTGAARVLLAIVERDPWIIFDVMTGQLSRGRD